MSEVSPAEYSELDAVPEDNPAFSLRDELLVARRQMIAARLRSPHAAQILEGAANAPMNLPEKFGVEAHRVLAEQLATLPFFSRRALIMSLYYDLSPQQIAATLASSPELIEQALKFTKRTVKIPKEIRVKKEAPVVGRKVLLQVVQPPSEIVPLSEHSIELPGEPKIDVFVEARAGTSKERWGLHDSIRLAGFALGSGRVRINGPPDHPTSTMEKSTFLASLGLTNQEIADHLSRGEDTVKTHNHNFFVANNVLSRTQLAQYFFTNKYYTLEKPAEPLQLSERELDIALHIAEGLGNKQIATTLFLSENTVKTYVRRILHKTGLNAREKVALRLFMSGQAVQPQTEK